MPRDGYLSSPAPERYPRLPVTQPEVPSPRAPVEPEWGHMENQSADDRDGDAQRKGQSTNSQPLVHVRRIAPGESQSRKHQQK